MEVVERFSQKVLSLKELTQLNIQHFSVPFEIIQHLKLFSSYHVTNKLTSLHIMSWFIAPVPHPGCSVGNLILRTNNHAHPDTIM
jgi:hypothetical protein